MDVYLWTGACLGAVAAVLGGVLLWRKWSKTRRRPASELFLVIPDDYSDDDVQARAVRPAGSPRIAPSPQRTDGSRLIEGKTLAFFVPQDRTVQLLPGRLEVIDGEDSGQNIRFVQAPGASREVTFGRKQGLPYQHVQLRSPTASREHARMRFERDRWEIVNLSQTNPVVVNGEPLTLAGGERVLEDGDKVEMGEVVFAFRAR